MNEQINKLIVSLEPDAFMTYKGYLYHANDPKVLDHSGPEPLYTRQELEKFAELILGEICDMMEQDEDDAYHLIEPSERQTEYIRWLYDWRTRFVKHFGVE